MAYQSILFYKPYNVLCQFTNPEALDCLTLKDFVALPQLYPVGRLDRDSEGLLLLTNHGALKHRLIHPQFYHPRTYWAQVEGIPEEAALEQLRQGVRIKGEYQTRPAQVERLAVAPNLPEREPPIRFRKTVPTAWLTLTLTEGRNRQVRRMTAAVGLPTLRLVRAAIGLFRLPSESNGLPAPFATGDAPWLTLDGLQPGEWRSPTPPEQAALTGLLQSPRSPQHRRPTPLPQRRSRP